ncbi:MAG: hydrolase [Peptococcaceae bacterium]|jgi:FMN phosphatase YigB (HAD superfamily)|nr:hydrolase [Peptococcaceae bacterium]
MRKTILFDLDGTLLPLNIDLFIEKYINAISKFCAPLVEPRAFAQALWLSTGKMLQNDGHGTNEEVFMEHFLALIKKNKEEVYPLLEKFYTQEFGKLQKYIESSSLAHSIVKKVVDRGWDIVLATNPVFPRLAIEERMRWAKIDGLPWRYITTYENSRSCKPSLRYYEEIIDKLQLDPAQCWMVGNDMEEDIVAGKLGFRTYLVTDFLIDKGKGGQVPDYQGSLQDFLVFVESDIEEGSVKNG